MWASYINEIKSYQNMEVNYTGEWELDKNYSGHLNMLWEKHNKKNKH